MGLIRDIQLANRIVRPKVKEVLRLIDKQQMESYAIEKLSTVVPTLEEKRDRENNEAQNYGSRFTNETEATIEEKRDRENAEAANYAERNRVTQGRAQGRVKMTTTEGRLYFIALNTLDRLDIQFVPDKLSIARNPNIATIQVIGRNNPIYHYVSGDTRLTLDLDFHAMEENREDVLNKCRWLEHLAYNDGFDQEPQKVKLVFGDVFRDSVWTITKVNYDLSNFNKQKGFLPQQAYASVELSLDPNFNLGWEDVRRDNGNSHLGPNNGRTQN